MKDKNRETQEQAVIEEQELYRIRLGSVGAAVLATGNGRYALSLSYEVEPLCRLENEEPAQMLEAVDSCLDLMNALQNGESVLDWKRRTGTGSWLFQPGRVVMTPGAADVLVRACIGPGSLLQRHLSGDWGTVCAEDREENERALVEGLRLMSVYPLPDTAETLWIITEWDRSVTTLLCPHEY
jgi:hypothetical protein